MDTKSLDTAIQGDKLTFSEKTTADEKEVYFCTLGKFEVQFDKATGIAAAVYANEEIEASDPDSKLLTAIADAMERKAAAQKAELAAELQKLLDELTEEPVVEETPVEEVKP